MYVLVLLSAVFLDLQGYLEVVAEAVEEKLLVAYLAFGVLLVIIVQPWCWGYVAVVTLAGFLFGWFALPLVIVCVQIGSALAFFQTRYKAQSFVQQSIQKLNPKKQLLVKKLQAAAAEKRVKDEMYSSKSGAETQEEILLLFGLSLTIFFLVLGCLYGAYVRRDIIEVWLVGYTGGPW